MKTGFILVAHPDDEFIFIHNLVTTRPNPWSDQIVDWQIMCATYDSESQRGKEFQASCEVLGAKPLQLGLADEQYSPLEFRSYADPKSRGSSTSGPPLEFNWDLDRFDEVYTHNPVGEYWHRHHQDCYNWVRSHRRKPFWVFAQNYHIPQRVISNEEKLKSPCLKIYERETYILYNFDLITEGFCKVQ